MNKQYPAASSNSGRTASPRGSKNGSGGKAGSRLGPEVIWVFPPSSIVTPADEVTDKLEPAEGITEVERNSAAGTLATLVDANVVPTPLPLWNWVEEVLLNEEV